MACWLLRVLWHHSSFQQKSWRTRRTTCSELRFYSTITSRIFNCYTTLWELQLKIGPVWFLWRIRCPVPCMSDPNPTKITKSEYMLISAFVMKPGNSVQPRLSLVSVVVFGIRRLLKMTLDPPRSRSHGESNWVPAVSLETKKRLLATLADAGLISTRSPYTKAPTVSSYLDVRCQR